MTKIAVATEDGLVAPHFGHCASYRVYEVDGATVRSSQEIENTGHGCGFGPGFLASLGTDVVIAGGIGAGAINHFQGHGIQVVAGATGPADASVQQYLAGALADAGSACGCSGHGEGHGTGHDHGDSGHGCGC